MNPSKGMPGAPEAVPELTGDERRQLVEALLAAFDDEDGLKQLARFRLDEDLAEIAGGDNLRDLAFDLVEWAAREGRTPGLVEAALEERPGNPELRRFEREVWTKPRPAVNARRLGTAPGEAKRSKAQESRTEDGPWWKVTEKVLVPLVVAIIGAGGLGFLLNQRNNDAPGAPKVSITDARLMQIGTDERGEVLDIQYTISLTNMEGSPVRVQAKVLDADSRQEAALSSDPDENLVTPPNQDTSRVGTISVPFPWERGCILVRVAASDEGGGELGADETPAFDPYEPSNESCPMGSATSVQSA